MTVAFQNWIILEINEVLRQPGAPLLIWCDPELSWLELLQRASESGSLCEPWKLKSERHFTLATAGFHPERVLSMP